MISQGNHAHGGKKKEHTTDKYGLIVHFSLFHIRDGVNADKQKDKRGDQEYQHALGGGPEV